MSVLTPIFHPQLINKTISYSVKHPKMARVGGDGGGGGGAMVMEKVEM